MNGGVGLQAESSPATRSAQSLEKRTKVMGIVNVTPDSFFDGGLYAPASSAIEHAYRLIEEGADILDIGAESTRPHFQAVAQEEEWRRLKPVLTELCRNSPVPISVDTYKARTAAAALEVGVTTINDIWGGLADEDMLRIIASSTCNYIWMHNRPEPVTSRVLETLTEETKLGIDRCLDAGIEPTKLWIDPGIGFGKTRAQNLIVMQRLQGYCELGFPVLLGTSRKGFIGMVVGGEPSDRLEGTLATVCLGVAAGVHTVRVHDVQACVKACRMTEAILYAHE